MGTAEPDEAIGIRRTCWVEVHRLAKVLNASLRLAGKSLQPAASLPSPPGSGIEGQRARNESAGDIELSCNRVHRAPRSQHLRIVGAENGGPLGQLQRSEEHTSELQSLRH